MGHSLQKQGGHRVLEDDLDVEGAYDTGLAFILNEKPQEEKADKAYEILDLKETENVKIEEPATKAPATKGKAKAPASAGKGKSKANEDKGDSNKAPVRQSTRNTINTGKNTETT